MKCTIFAICAGVVELADARDSKSRGRKAVRGRPPPPAPVFSQSRSMGVEPASGAERQGGDTPQPHHRPEQNQEMSPVDRERGSPEPRRKGRWRDRLRLKAGDPLLPDPISPP